MATRTSAKSARKTPAVAKKAAAKKAPVKKVGAKKAAAKAPPRRKAVPKKPPAGGKSSGKPGKSQGNTATGPTVAVAYTVGTLAVDKDGKAGLLVGSDVHEVDTSGPVSVVFWPRSPEAGSAADAGQSVDAMKSVMQQIGESVIGLEYIAICRRPT